LLILHNSASCLLSSIAQKAGPLADAGTTI
jgi:hypothetical protein